MKKIIVFAIILINSLAIAQKEKNKFFVGLNYGFNLSSGNYLSKDFNGNLCLALKYAPYQNEKVKFNIGLDLNYLSGNEYLFKDDVFVFNPNVGLEIDAFKSKLKPFINVGYHFFKDEVAFFTNLNFYNPTDPRFQLNKEIKFNGFTLNPGLNYYINNMASLNLNYKFYNINSNSDDSTIGNANTINLGIGLNF